MFLFKNLLHFPSIYREREKHLKDLKIVITSTKYNKESNTLLISGNINNYNQQILLNLIDDKINKTSPIKIHCDCDSFKFEFAKGLNNADGLLNSEIFKPYFSKIPKDKNIHQIQSGCKHLIAIAQFINHFQYKFEGDIK